MIGLAPELKHPTHFASLGLAMEGRLLDALNAHPHTRTAPVVIQSFETANLRALREPISRGSNLTLLQLYGDPNEKPYDTVAAGKPRTYASLATPEALREVATYADAIGPHYLALAPRKAADGRPRSALVDAAHTAGLKVIVYTFRPENHFLPGDYRGAGGPAARHETGSMPADPRRHCSRHRWLLHRRPGRGASRGGWRLRSFATDRRGVRGSKSDLHHQSNPRASASSAAEKSTRRNEKARRRRRAFR